ncbi:SCO7613 C-terminal domain-containing membrane protein, partial [Modestobacter versicolor]
GPGRAGPLLLLLAVTALAAASLERHHRDEGPLAVSAVVVGVVAVAHVGRTGDPLALAAALAVLGTALVGYAARTGRRPARAGGCAGLVAAVWLAVGDAGVQVPEAYSLPLAAVLLLYSGRRLATAPSWSAWGPALAAGYGPSVFLALVEPELLRVLLVVVAATATTTAATGWAVRAPFLVGAGSLVVVGVGRLLAVLPPPGLVVFGVAGAALLAVGASYESRRRRARVAIASLADMR